MRTTKFRNVKNYRQFYYGYVSFSFHNDRCRHFKLKRIPSYLLIQNSFPLRRAIFLRATLMHFRNVLIVKNNMMFLIPYACNIEICTLCGITQMQIIRQEQKICTCYTYSEVALGQTVLLYNCVSV